MPGGDSELLGTARAGENSRLFFTDTEPPAGATSYRLRELGPFGTEQWHGPFSLSSLPAGLTVSAPAPNPFREVIHFASTIPAAGHFSLQIHDVQGRLVRRLADASTPTGVFEYSWDGRDDAGRPVSAGVYWIQARTQDQRVSRKAILLR
jgi:hypothetical protein